MALSTDRSERIARLAVARFGLRVSAGAASGLERRIDRILRSRGDATPAAEFLDRLERAGDAEAWRVLFEALATHVTGFFRDGVQFHLLEREFWTPLGRGHRPAPPGGLRLWSAACSIGCEAYSLALQAEELLPPSLRAGCRILATDLSAPSLAIALRGEYADALLAPVPRALLDRYFPREAASGRRRAAESLRRLVAFRRLNLVEPWPFAGAFDLVLARNVLMHFDAAARATIARRLAARLRPGGLLLVGAAETLFDLGLELVRIGPGAYRR
jgi:chemotaxis protein methyltransferase CheR